MKQISFGRPVIGDAEKDAVCSVMDSGIMVHGPKINEFEKAFADFTDAPYAIGVSSCTAALHLAYFMWGIGPGDEVIVPAQTHVATAHAVEYVGARPVFVDAEIATGNIDIEKIEPLITEKTKAISLVHYLGMPVDMRAICAIAKEHNLRIVEDCALSIGGRLGGIHTGLWGDVGCFSFYPVKHMTTAEGGMFIMRDEELAAKATAARAFGIDRHHGQRKVPGQYDVNSLGFNYRMSELQSVMGIEQLKRLPQFIEDRKKNYGVLLEGLSELEGTHIFKSDHGDFESSHYCFSIVLDDELAAQRVEIIYALKEKGVGTSIYYPKAVPVLSYYRNKYGYREGDYPIAERISNQSIALPVGPHLADGDAEYIAGCVRDVIRKNM